MCACVSLSLAFLLMQFTTKATWVPWICVANATDGARDITTIRRLPYKSTRRNTQTFKRIVANERNVTEASLFSEKCTLWHEMPGSCIVLRFDWQKSFRFSILAGFCWFMAIFHVEWLCACVENSFAFRHQTDSPWGPVQHALRWIRFSLLFRQHFRFVRFGFYSTNIWLRTSFWRLIEIIRPWLTQWTSDRVRIYNKTNRVALTAQQTPDAGVNSAPLLAIKKCFWDWVLDFIARRTQPQLFKMNFDIPLCLHHCLLFIARAPKLLPFSCSCTIICIMITVCHFMTACLFYD